MHGLGSTDMLSFLATNVATLYFASACMWLSCTDLKFWRRCLQIKCIYIVLFV